MLVKLFMGGTIDTNSDVILQALRLLSQLFHFTHGNGCQARSPTDRQEVRSVDPRECWGKLLNVNIHWIVTVIMTVQFIWLLVEELVVVAFTVIYLQLPLQQLFAIQTPFDLVCKSSQIRMHAKFHLYHHKHARA